MEKELMKIESVKFGFGGYQDAMFGLSVNLSGGGSGVSDFKGMWSIETEYSKNCKWSEKDRDNEFAKTMRYVNKLLIDSKKSSVDQLTGVPVEVLFENNTLKSWRILTEVL